MAKGQSKAGPIFLVLFLVFSFGAGIILVTASQQNTEGRSKAAAYNSPTPPVNVSPTSTDQWGQCMRWDAQNNCLDTYRTYKRKRDADWRCKEKFVGYGLCPYDPVEYPPGNP